jgi:hypothetical protein
MINIPCPDKYWLLERNPGAPNDKIEAFLERVAIMVVDGKVEENKARELAYLAYFGSY